MWVNKIANISHLSESIRNRYLGTEIKPTKVIKSNNPWIICKVASLSCHFHHLKTIMCVIRGELGKIYDVSGYPFLSFTPLFFNFHCIKMCAWSFGIQASYRR